MKTLYVHIPFCEKKCFYCSFVIAVGQSRQIDRYLDCLEKEARQYSREKVASVYIGGGTPTVMSAAQLARLLAVIEERFDISSAAERTIESNPEGLDRAKLEQLKLSGITRVSLGVQSLQDRYLRFLGRNHDAREAQEAFRRIREVGFNNISVDLMFGFPEQTTEELREDIAAITRLESDHISLYALTVEENSRFFARKIRLQDDQDQATKYLLADDMLPAAGFEQYEISNFARPGKTSAHNIHYWQGGEYIGLGVGAHSYIGSKRFWNVARLNDYMSRVENNLPAMGGFEDLTAFDQMRDAVLFGLRMNQGIKVDEIKERFSCYLNDEQQTKVKDFIRGGFLVEENGFLKASVKGRLVLDELCAQLV